MTELNDISEALVACDESRLTQLIESHLGNGTPAVDILNRGLIAGMDVVGDKMEAGEMFIPEVLRAAQLMGRGIDRLKPMLAEGDTLSKGRVVIGTVKGDLHDIGKNLVAMMLASSGFEVVNLGVDIGPEQFVDAVREKAPHMVCLSALLTTTMPVSYTHLTLPTN